MTQYNVQIEYFAWLCDIVCGNRYSKQISYTKLLTRLHNTEFRYFLQMDENRADDGVDLRYRFSLDAHYDIDYLLDDLGGPCSVLEMMIALAIRCEETIMDNTDIGDRTGQWFWNMVTNLGIGSMTDDRYDEQFVDDAIATFLNREYEPDGTGGLFTIRDCDCDLRTVEIWHQLCWYLDSIT